MSTENESDTAAIAPEVIDGMLPAHADDLPPIDFSTFIVSLRASARMHLDGEGGDEENALAFARQEIDLLGILHDKTRGNLTPDEQLLLTEILFDLRTRYLAARRAQR